MHVKRVHKMRKLSTACRALTLTASVAAMDLARRYAKAVQRSLEVDEQLRKINAHFTPTEIEEMQGKEKVWRDKVTDQKERAKLVNIYELQGFGGTFAPNNSRDG